MAFRQFRLYCYINGNKCFHFPQTFIWKYSMGLVWIMIVDLFVCVFAILDKHSIPLHFCYKIDVSKEAFVIKKDVSKEAFVNDVETLSKRLFVHLNKIRTFFYNYILWLKGMSHQRFDWSHDCVVQFLEVMLINEQIFLSSCNVKTN